MDFIHLPHPQKPAQYMPVDLDSREPLTWKEITGLYEELERRVRERAEISERIRKINQRIVLSGEEIKAGGQDGRNDL